MYKSVATALACAVSCPAGASVFPFIDPISAEDTSILGQVESSKSVFQCMDAPLEHFNETSAKFDRQGYLTSRSTISQNLNYFLHPLASMGELKQVVSGGITQSYSMRNDSQGDVMIFEGETLKSDERRRPTIIKATATTRDIRGEERRVQMVHGLKYQPGLIVIDNRIKSTGIPTVAYKSVAEVSSTGRLLRHTAQNPETKALLADYEAKFEDERPTEEDTWTGGKVRFYYEGEDLTRIEAYAALGLVSYIVNISDIQKDDCGNVVNARLRLETPAVDKLDALFNTPRNNDILLGEERTPTSDSFPQPRCKDFEMVNTYTYYSACK